MSNWLARGSSQIWNNSHGPRWALRFGFLERGDLKYLILYTLKEKPMHGYEIMKSIRNRFSGFYIPSPGVIYPTLEMLQDMRYVILKEGNGRKVYSITDEGLKILEEKHDVVDRIMKGGRGYPGFERMEFLKGIGEISRLVALNLDELSDKKIDEIKGILSDARTKICEVILREDSSFQS